MPALLLVIPLRRMPARHWRMALFCSLWLFAGVRVNGQAPPGDGTLFVAMTGNDRWSGTLAAPNTDKSDGPVATLDRAVQAYRQRKAAGQPASSILIRTGTYFPGQMIELGPNDSGSPGHPFTIAAYPGEQPVIDGGRRLPRNWKKNGQGPLWTLQLPDVNHPVQDLFVNGVRQPRARVPREGYWKALPVGKSRTQFQFAPGQIPDWPDVTNAVVVIKPYQWAENTLPIRSIDQKTQTVTVSSAGSYPLVGNPGEGDSGAYYIENVSAGLSGPGAWCYDMSRGVITFWPPDGVDPTRAESIAGAFPVIFSIAGDVPNNKWVENIVLDGLTIRHAGRARKARFMGGAAVRFVSNVQSCGVVHCLFEDDEASGVVAWKRCRNLLISGNEFNRTGDTSIYFFDDEVGAPSLSVGNVIENNSIHDSGTVARDIYGIELEGIGHNRVAHNLIYNMPYIGIRLSGMQAAYWPPNAVPALKPPFTDAAIKPYLPEVDNVFEFNYIHDVMQKMHDGSGIYCFGVMGNGPNIVRDNLIEHVGEVADGTYAGIYLDDHVDDVQCMDNIVVDANYGLHLHGAPRNLLENNIFAYSRQNDISVHPESYNIAPMNSVLIHNIYFQCKESVFRDTSFAKWDKKPLAESDYNLYWPVGGKVALGQGLFAGFDKHSLVADPQFKDPAHGDFSLAIDSPAYALGIHPVNLAGAGLTSAVGPRSGAVPAK